DIGYAVFAGGATNKDDGKDINGYAGGFVGLNHEGLLDNNKMIKADTIRGTANKIGEFSGTTTLESSYAFNTVYGIEGNHNTYQVYRLFDNDNLTKICIGTEGDKILVGNSTEAQISGTNYYLYDVVHLNVNGVGAPSLDGHDNWKNAYQTAENESVRIPLNVYVSEAQADLMLGTPTGEVVTDPPKEDDLAQDPCSQDAFITIQKRWIDDNNASGDREGSISVTIIQKKEDGSQISMPITMDSSMANADENSWSIVKELPMFYEKEDGSTGKYTYEVVEDTIDGYLTIYEQSKDGYTFYITNYRTTSIMDGDSVVIDYGLPVVVDVMENDRIANDSELQGTLTGVTKINRDGETDGVNSEVYSQDAITSKLWTEDEANAASCTGNYGKAEIDAEDKNSIRYTPTNMQMDNFEKLLYAVKVNGKTKNDQNYVYSTLDIIPATQIYYEDNFTTVINYNSGEDKNGNGIDWKVEGTTDENRTQDVNRPGMRQITKALDDNTEKTYDVNYGFDTSYVNDNMFGAGSAHYVTVNKDTDVEKFPSLEFTFTGTGFDIISLTNNQTGTIIARVYKVDENGDVAENAKPIRSWVVDTYYGYRFDTENKEWVIDNTVDTPLYQVPIIRSDDNSMGPLDYGTYKVTITLTYSSIIDNTDDNEIPNGYKYYFDGVRIYGSANKNNSDYQVIEDAYIADHENNPEYLEIRDMLIAHGEDPTLEEVPKPGFGFIDGSISEVTLSDYINYGPKHETYLKPGQAISFYLESDYKPDAVHIGAKVASGSNLNLGLYLVNRENDTWVPYKERTDIVLNSTGELFRDLSNQCVWEEVEVAGQTKYRTRYPIVICNNEQPSVQDENNGFQDIISLTQIKLTGKPTNTTTEELGFRVYSNYDSVEAAYSVVRSQFEKKITVKYVDLNGNSITQDEIKKVEVNKTYDVSDLANKEINGYSIVEVKGDVTGTADSDKEVTVVYGKNYQLKVNYVDLQGNQLEEAYVEKTVEGNTYDLTEASKQEISGYSIVEVKGDVTGTADSNKEVTVVYGKNYQLIVQYLDENGNKLAKDYTVTGIEGNRYDLSLQVNVKINGYEFDKVIGDLITGIIDQDKVVKVLYIKETNSDMTNNDSNKPNQDHTMDNNNITSLKTGDDINITFALIGLCLSILMGWVFIRKSKKFKDE
ncbi:MAG: MucBP domain-containing protein, partial [Thomasclavelia spiroformis]